MPSCSRWFELLAAYKAGSASQRTADIAAAEQLAIEIQTHAPARETAAELARDLERGGNL